MGIGGPTMADLEEVGKRGFEQKKAAQWLCGGRCAARSCAMWRARHTDVSKRCPPEITTDAPTAATEGSAYTYSPQGTDPESSSLTWSVDSSDTCDGSVDSATGSYSFTPTGPADCILVSRCGWNLPGALIVGDEPFQLYLKSIRSPLDLVDSSERQQRYPEFARAILDFGTPGSSAAGEQPKFVATRKDGASHTPVIVKFAPPGDNPANIRTSDILIAECLSLATLSAHGIPAAAAQLVRAERRVFLEVERFDRVGIEQRIGQISLEALDSQFVGSAHRSWSESVLALHQQGIVPLAALHRVQFLEYYGHLMANTDMHFGNLAFITEGVAVKNLAPAYDMSPTLYQPRLGEVVPRTFDPPIPSPALASAAKQALVASIDFWSRVSSHEWVSDDFRSIAAHNAARVKELAKLADFLPQ